MSEIAETSFRILLVTRQAMLIALGIFLVIAVLVFAVMIPQGQAAWDEYQNIERERPVLEQLQQKVVALENLPSSPEYAQIDIVNNALPSRKPLLELLVGLSSVSSETNVQVNNYNLSPGLVATDSTQLRAGSGGGSGFDSLKLTMSVQGTFRDLQNFLRRVEEVSPFSTITSLALSNTITSETGESPETADQLFQAQLETETYFFTRSIAVRYESPLPELTARDREVLQALSSFVPTELPEQNQIEGGGLEDLFQIRSELETQGFSQ